MIKVAIDKDKNDSATEELALLLNKNKVCEIFRDIDKILDQMTNKEDDGQEKIKQKENPLLYCKKKYQRISKFTILSNLRLLINVKAICGVLYIKALIKRTELAKYLFVHEIEYGGEVYIPNELSQDMLPHSFRYYDPIMTFVQDNMDDDKRDFY